jgi:hypothetical protein
MTLPRDSACVYNIIKLEQRRNSCTVSRIIPRQRSVLRTVATIIIICIFILCHTLQVYDDIIIIIIILHAGVVLRNDRVALVRQCLSLIFYKRIMCVCMCVCVCVCIIIMIYIHIALLL